MSPILVRPVREQFEHDRVIRVLQTRYKRKFDVAINPGPEQNASVNVGDLTMHPDVVLYSQDRGRKLQATIEVETTESINTLEAMAEWVQFSRLRVPFLLYVPPNSVDTVKRLCTEYQVKAAEIWTYHTAVDQVRFTMVHREHNALGLKGGWGDSESPEKLDKPAKPVRREPPHKVEKVAKAQKPVRKVAATKSVKTAKKAVARTVVAKPAKTAKKAAKKAARKTAPAAKSAKAGKRR